MVEQHEREQIPVFRRTIILSALLPAIERGDYDFCLPEIFDVHCLFEVREVIIKHCLDYRVGVLDRDADWIEKRILDLAEEKHGSRLDRNLWREMLNWYIFNANTDLVSRAMEFAIGISQRGNFFGSLGFFESSNILKMVVARLERTPEIYQDIAPSVKPFLLSFLKLQYQSRFDVIDYEMIDIKRVVRCAMAVRDWSFLPHLEKLLAKIYQSQENRLKKAYTFRKEVEILETQAFLKEAIRLFKEKIEEEIEEEKNE